VCPEFALFERIVALDEPTKSRRQLYIGLKRNITEIPSPEWIADAERAINRKPGPAKRGPKPRGGRVDGN
jgi:hypothetical protein